MQSSSHKERKVHNGYFPHAVEAAVAAAGAVLFSVCRRDGGLYGAEKTGRKINFPPGLKLGVVTPKEFEVVNGREPLMPFFLRAFFLSGLFLSFCCHRLFPPFNPQMRCCVKSWE
jgi:hypothetical protein